MPTADHKATGAGPEAFALYTGWLQQVGERRPAFEDLCVQHPLVRNELCALHALADFARSASLHRSLRDIFAEEAEIALTLEEGQGSAADERAAVGLAAAGPPQVEWPQGASRYALQGEIARGGMGIIYKVHDRELNRILAMKVMLAAPSADADPGRQRLRSRFFEEVQVTAQLDHPGIVAVHELGLDSAGRPYFTMKLVKGRDLGCIFDLARAEREEWNLPRAVGALVKACQAVAFAHSKGVLHRDLKPANIMVGRFGEVYVMDWGLAKVTGRNDLHDLRVRPASPHTITEIRTPRGEGGSTTADSPLITMDGSVVGTPAYMPPEQAKGQVEQVDAASDVYSLGAILYNLLTGQAPYAEPGARLSPHTILARVLDGPPKSIHALNPKAPAELVAVCEKAMAREKGNRYRSSLDLAEDLQAWLDRRVVKAYRTGAAAELKAWVVRNQTAAVAGAAVVVILLVALATVLFENHQIVRARRSAEKNLYGSLLREARATRNSRREGYRDELFHLVQQAHALRLPGTDPSELRSEIVGCLGDFVGLKPRVLADFPSNTKVGLIQIDPSSRLVALTLSATNTIQLRDLSSGKQTASLNTEARPWSIAFSPAGDRLIAVEVPDAPSIQEGLAGSLIQVWAPDANGHWQAIEKQGMPGAHRCLAWQQGIAVVVADLAAHAVQLIDFETKKVLHRSPLAPIVDPAFAAVVSPQGNLFVLEIVDPGAAGEVAFEIWDLLGGKVRRIEPHLARGRSVSFSPDGKYMALLCEEGVSVYSADTLERLGLYRDTFDAIARVSFAPGATILALPSRALRRVRLWDWVKNEDLARLDEPKEVIETVFTPDGRLLLTSTGDELRLYTLQRPAEKVSLVGHTGGVPGLSFSPDGAHLASVGEDRTLRIWETVAGELAWPVKRLSGKGQSVGYFSNGRFLASTRWDTELVEVWDSTGQQRLGELGINVPSVGWSAQFSPDGHYLATASSWGPNSGVRVWEIEARPGSELGQTAKPPVRFFRSDASSLVFAPAGNCLAFVDRSSQGRLYVWDLDETGPPRVLARNYFESVNNHSFTPGGRMLITLNSNREVITLDVATGKQVRSFPTPRDAKESDSALVCLSPSGTKLAIGWPSGLGVGLWDPRSGKLLYSLPEQSGLVWWAAWSPDSQQFAIARSNGDVAIWKLSEVDRILAGLGLSAQR